MPSHRISGDPHLAVVVKQGARLPHWTRECATYHVTFRLDDSVPAEQRCVEYVLTNPQNAGLAAWEWVGWREEEEKKEV